MTTDFLRKQIQLSVGINKFHQAIITILDQMVDPKIKYSRPKSPVQMSLSANKASIQEKGIYCYQKWMQNSYHNSSTLSDEGIRGEIYQESVTGGDKHRRTREAVMQI